MKVAPDGAALDPSDSYESPWIGAGNPAASRTVSSDGQLALGIHGSSGAEVDCLGLILAGGDATLDPSPVEGSAEGALVGHWPLDGSAVEVSGLSAPGKVVGPVAWGEGKIGRAAVFDGKGGHIELPHTGPLDRVGEGSHTLSAWFKPLDVPPGKGSDNDVQYGVLIKGKWQVGLIYDRERKFIAPLYFRGDPFKDHSDLTTTGLYDPGRWYHVVNVVHRSAGRASLYVDGELRGTLRFSPNAPFRDQAQDPWRIGIGGPGWKIYARPAKGSIDDVRIYNRALTAAAVKELYESAGK
jgi:hypothetical protein